MSNDASSRRGPDLPTWFYVAGVLMCLLAAVGHVVAFLTDDDASTFWTVLRPLAAVGFVIMAVGPARALRGKRRAS